MPNAVIWVPFSGYNMDTFVLFHWSCRNSSAGNLVKFKTFCLFIISRLIPKELIVLCDLQNALFIKRKNKKILVLIERKFTLHSKSDWNRTDQKSINLFSFKAISLAKPNFTSSDVLYFRVSRYGSVRYGSVRYGTVRFGMVRYDTA